MAADDDELEHDHDAACADCTAGDCPTCEGIGYLPDEDGAPDCAECDGTGYARPASALGE